MAAPSPWIPEQNHRKRAIDELVRGRELAYALQLAMKRSLSTRQLQDLVSKIIGSFRDTLSILHYSSSSSSPESDEFSQIPMNPPPLPPPLTVDSQYASDARKSEDSSDSCKPLTATSKDRRGCYKRRYSFCFVWFFFFFFESTFDLLQFYNPFLCIPPLLCSIHFPPISLHIYFMPHIFPLKFY